MPLIACWHTGLNKTKPVQGRKRSENHAGCPFQPEGFLLNKQ